GDLKALVDAQNLFGTPAQNRRVTATLTLRPAWPAFPSWPGYNFFATHRAKDGYTTDLQDSTTDAHGHAEFPLDLKQYADATYQLTFLARAFEAGGGRGVTASARTLVSNQDWLVGYKSADDLDYIKRGTPRAVKLIAINPQAKAMALQGLRAQLVEKRYVSVLTKQDSGVYQYVSRLKEVPVEEKPLSIPAAGLDLALRTDKPGNYALVIRNTGGAEVNRIEYSVAGDANVSRSLDRNAELQITLSKHDYQPGEQVDVAIRAPYAGSGLITIERDKVYAHAWFHADTTSSIQHITVPQGFEGSGYINVQYVRDPSSDEIFMSPLSYGVVPFSVNLDARRNALTVDAPALVKPGETATFTVHSAQPAKVVVFAVDEGILQVAHYKLGDPLKFFFRKRMLQVDTAQILDLILPDFKKLMAIAAPGGDEDNDIGRQLNPFKRKRDKPVVFWSGIVDVNGAQRFTYPVPDYFNGRLHVMAVSVSPERIGTFEGATTVRGDFVLSPSVPTTLAPGDEAQVSVGVANNLTGAADKPMPIEVALKTGPQLQVLGSAAQSVALAPGREGVAQFRVKATDTLGSGALTFDAHYGGKAARQTVDLSVRPAAPFRTRIDLAQLGSGRQTRVPQLRRMYDAYAARDASISTTPMVFGDALAAYLGGFEHYCTEQLLSVMAPRLIGAKWLSARVLTKPTDQQFAPEGQTGADKTARFFDLLRSRQNDQGGFGLWSATQSPDLFVSNYAMHMLLDAREHGVSVPQDILDAGNGYLKKLAAGDSDVLGGGEGNPETLLWDDRELGILRQRAYAVYLLTRQGNVTTNDLAAVQKRLQEAYPKDWKNDLAAAWLAASYQLLKQNQEADALIAGPQKLLERNTTGDEPYRWGFFIDPLTRDASTLYLIARYFPDRVSTLSPRAIENIADPLQRDQFNTLSSAMTIMALDAYSHATASGLDQLAIDVTRPGGKATNVSTPQGGIMRSATWPADATRVDLVNDSRLPAWWIA
ncbi:MAG: alpha-2-macroglobulin family protein, partial [Burkholderiaceae bacterium]|nr:alpha-2-macroglobulin family protein [Burkholderiaceae bacterium]